MSSSSSPGYLITAHLFKEAVKTGGVRLGQFWARRIRRLLPLSLLVLFLTAISAVLILPSTAWQATLRQIIASTLYVQNWVLAADAVEYSKADERALRSSTSGRSRSRSSSTSCGRSCWR